MRPLLLAFLVLLTPLALASTVHDRNVAFIWSTLGEHDPLQPATMPDGRVVTLAEAVDEAAARAGPADLAAMVSGAAPPSLGEESGHIWIYEYGMGTCDGINAGLAVAISIDPQNSAYGGVGTMSTSHGYFTLLVNWTTKTTSGGNGGGFTFTGTGDFFCIDFGIDHIAFPFGFGWASLH